MIHMMKLIRIPTKNLEINKNETKKWQNTRYLSSKIKISIIKNKGKVPLPEANFPSYINPKWRSPIF